MRARLFGLTFLVFSLTIARSATATPILINGGFETGDFTGWTPFSSGFLGTLFGVSGVPHTGRYAAFFGGANFGPDLTDQIAQSFATTPGQLYTLGFWLEEDNVPCNGDDSIGEIYCFFQDFSAYWDSQRVFFTTFTSEFPYRHVSMGIKATGTTSTIRFVGANLPGYYRLDDVSVSAVPEPASLVLLGGGLGGLVLLRRRARRRS